MAVNSVASSNVSIQTTPPPRQPEPVARQAEPVAPAPVQQQQPPPQPMVNTSGQRLGSMINTTA
jgi:capsular polysaccharide biosynthesis protein